MEFRLIYEVRLLSNGSNKRKHNHEIRQFLHPQLRVLWQHSRALSPLEVYCELNLLYLRPLRPGNFYHDGDLDNRIKTLLDGLQKLQHCDELPKSCIPLDDEKPLFILLENDKLITKLSVETDNFLHFQKGQPVDENSTHMIITVNLRPISRNRTNMRFG